MQVGEVALVGCLELGACGETDTKGILVRNLESDEHLVYQGC